ncbi:MAG: hypothetical protein ACLFQA_10285 [Bacteroidales bacterium]
MKNFIGRAFILNMFLLVSFSIESAAHGISFETSKEPPVIIVKASFSATAPLVDARVDVYAPGDDQPYQSGRTDRTGNFAFMPDRSGEWALRVDDERGHADRATIEISDTFFTGDQPASEDAVAEEIKDQMVEVENIEVVNDFPVFYSIITGLALIFGLTGIIYGIKAKQAMNNNSEKS